MRYKRPNEILTSFFNYKCSGERNTFDIYETVF